MQSFDIGDLVEFMYDLILQDIIGIVTYSYMYKGSRWYKVHWSSGKLSDLTEVELKKV